MNDLSQNSHIFIMNEDGNKKKWFEGGLGPPKNIFLYGALKSLFSHIWYKLSKEQFKEL